VSDWLKVVMEGDVAGARKTAAVSLLDYKGETLKTYNFVNCWVRSVELNSLKAGATEQATEKFVICYDESTIS
jgi:phage tail-like protein